MIDFLRKFLFSSACTLCGEGREEPPFCPKCREEVDKLSRQLCPLCGKGQRDCTCVPSLLTASHAEEVHLFAYDTPLSKRLIFMLKRKNLKSLQAFFGRELSKAICRRFSEEDLQDCTLSFVPRTAKGVRLYGFDHAKRLCQETAKCLSLPMKTVFVHTGESAEQKGKDYQGRLDNAERSFRLVKNFVPQGKGLLLIDDVITTGATVEKLIRLANEAGYTKILVATVAKTEGEASRRLENKEHS